MEDRCREVIIIGGGAAGLMAAVCAAEGGAKVTVLEKGKQCGKKILATGNGKCNLTNLDIRPEYYHSDDQAKLTRMLNAFPCQQVMSFFADRGLLLKARGNYVYPNNGQASAVRDTLLYAARAAGVKIKTQCEITGVTSAEDGWRVHTPGWDYRSDVVVLACGSSASNIPEADGSGYGLVASLGHTMIAPLPALVPLCCTGVDTRRWAGVRMDGEVTLVIDGITCDTQRGEIQLTDYGISGIPVFQISSRAVRDYHEGRKVEVCLDALPDYTEDDLTKILNEYHNRYPKKNIQEILYGMLPDKFVDALPDVSRNFLSHTGKNVLPNAKDAFVKSTNAGTDWENIIDAGIKILKKLPLVMTGHKNEKQAQVLSGGVPLAEVDEHLQSAIHKNLYFAGELLNVDGPCGGYNLQWAWNSGAIVGMSVILNN